MSVDFESEIKRIHERNAHVEENKAWETSLVRRGCIATMTYVCALIFIQINGFDHAALQALIPTGGYALSTMSLPSLKKLWMKRKS